MNLQSFLRLVLVFSDFRFVRLFPFLFPFCSFSLCTCLFVLSCLPVKLTLSSCFIIVSVVLFCVLCGVSLPVALLQLSAAAVFPPVTFPLVIFSLSLCVYCILSTESPLILYCPTLLCASSLHALSWSNWIPGSISVDVLRFLDFVYV